MENAKMTKKQNSESPKNPKSTRFTRSVAIRLKCKDCMEWQPVKVRKCHIKECSLWEFRLGPGRIEPLEDNIPVHGRDEGRF